MSKNTPGPWKIEKRTTRGEFVTTTHIVSKDGDHIAEVGPCNIEANARLVAAAPELLEILEWITHCASIKGPAGTTAYVIGDKYIETARSVVAKTKGEKI